MVNTPSKPRKPPKRPVPPAPGGKRSRTQPTGRTKLRVDRFLEVATEVFLEKGYRDTRLTDIVARSGGSLSTLYASFGNKEGLVHAIMELSIRHFGEGLDILDNPDLTPAEALPAAAERLAAEMLSPERTVSHRIIIGEALAFPELRDWFFEHGVDPAHVRLAGYFSRHAATGTLVIEHPDVAARQFYMAAFGETIILTTSGKVGIYDLDKVRAEARESAETFLRGILPR
ncbi:MAG TPA: TetR/AcrR family transcriptional regulator [Luteimonas sp.]|nr:TetR/AcrR family transcriptional regulator [Luteimonas sp.]HRO26131.1 TetR/AcrR family transcriptional regulator [Luteimonas sp.]HRP72123.1 TetR/AcrR family transcriptional regulator [Luteimonas sp.]